MEAIVVIVVISVALLTLFASYNKILGKLKEENKFDLSEHLYKTHYIKDFLVTNKCVDNTTDIYKIGSASSSDSPKNFYTKLTCNGSEKYLTNIFSSFNIKKIYILTDINGTYTSTNLNKFDAYMFVYIKQLVVDDNASLIIVEFSKTDRDSYYNPNKLYGTETELEETYIASLEW